MRHGRRIKMITLFREANCRADAFANMGKDLEDNFIVSDEPPSCFMTSIQIAVLTYVIREK